MIYYSSDNHYFHHNILNYSNRPFQSVDEMNSEMINRWNSIVNSEDTIYHLGDFCLGKSEDISLILSQLNGYKVLIMGNHDRSLEFNKNAGWNEVHKDLYIEDRNQIAWLNHFPYMPSEDVYNPKHTRPKATRNWDIALCGHVHKAWMKNKYNCINVGVDVWNFYPQTLQQLIEKSGWNGKVKI